MKEEKELSTIDELINILEEVKRQYAGAGNIRIGIAEFSTLLNKTFNVSNLSVQVIKVSEDKEEYATVLSYEK
jgi:hypothetical protein